MTPLTHAAVGTALYQKLQGGRRNKRTWWTTSLALLLSFLSHYVLDAIPHYEEFGPLLRYRETVWVFVAFGLIGLGFAWLLARWSREAAWICVALAPWIALGGNGPALWRLGAALLPLVIATISPGKKHLGYVVAAMASLSPDFFPASWHALREIHQAVHYQVDWGTRLYASFVGQPVPRSWYLQITNPYFLAGWTLELIIEGAFFFGSIWILIRGLRAANTVEDGGAEIVGASALRISSVSAPQFQSESPGQV